MFFRKEEGKKSMERNAELIADFLFDDYSFHSLSNLKLISCSIVILHVW